MNMSPRRRPPLDQGFFKSALQTHEGERALEIVIAYMQTNYRQDIKLEAYDSLERVMAAIYTDVYGGHLEASAFAAFLALVKAFVARLAATTKEVPMTRRCLLYRLVAQHLNRGVRPENLAIISFNQDIQIEKVLHRIATTGGRSGRETFAFPGCYRLPFGGQLTAPPKGEPQFDENREFVGIALLKLHGSLNWYSRHNARNPSIRAIFDDTRLINVSRRQRLLPTMTLRGKQFGRARFAFPVIVPPIVHKSGILHPDLQEVWATAERRLREAYRVIVFGYSCPNNDWESANLLARTMSGSSELKEVSIIDLQPGVVLRFVQLANLKAVNYYSSCKSYLEAE
jgi:hypothetical protein